jgi:hypothetical protein
VSELIGEFQIRSRTYLRDDETGRFISAVHAGAAAAAFDLANTLANLIKGGILIHTNTRTGTLLSSVQAFLVGTSEGQVIIGADYAAPLDRGAVAHWIPNAFGSGRPVWHPGNKPPLEFVRDAEQALTAMAGDIIRGHMP